MLIAVLDFLLCCNWFKEEEEEEEEIEEEGEKGRWWKDMKKGATRKGFGG